VPISTLQDEAGYSKGERILLAKQGSFWMVHHKRLKQKEFCMRTITTLAVAAAIVAPSLMATSVPAEARKHREHREYREWRGQDGRTYCRKSDGTVGLVVGAAAGGLVGRAVDTRGERATGTILGAAAGALLGREVSRKRSCR
jgi:uncharacterized protein YcfJ